MDRGKLITLHNGVAKTPCSSAWGSGQLFALPECVRAAVGTTGHSIAGGQCELIQASSSEVRSGQ